MHMPYMNNYIWGLKQHILQINGHVWYHLQGLRRTTRNEKGAKTSKLKYMSPAGFEQTPGIPQIRPLIYCPRQLGHAGYTMIYDLMFYKIIGYKQNNHVTTRVKLIMVTFVLELTVKRNLHWLHLVCRFYRSLFTDICIGYSTINDFIHVLSRVQFYSYVRIL